MRFQLTSEGLKLQKINNKIDVPLSWRSNMSAEHNKAWNDIPSEVTLDDLFKE